MSDLSITAANVVPGADARITHGVAGTTITAGKAVYLDATTGKWALADDNSATAAARKAGGIALTGSSLNQPISVITSGTVTIGATLTAGVTYYLSGTAGGICPVADLTTGDYPCIIGVATSTTVLNVQIISSGASL